MTPEDAVKLPTLPPIALKLYQPTEVSLFAQAYARAAVLAERERCAKVCESLAPNAGYHPEYRRGVHQAATLIRIGEEVDWLERRVKP